MRRALHLASVALITSGAVVLADAAATLVWQEPVSAAYAAFQQARAGAALDRLEQSFADDLATIDETSDERTRARIGAKRLARQISAGDAIGRIEIGRIGVELVILEGTTTGTLQRGPGHYEKTPLPGLAGTVGIAGHRTTYGAPLRHIDEIRDGDQIRITVPYAVFTYTVQKHEIVDADRVDIVEPVGYERLVLTACHPLYSAARRWAVFAKLSGIDPPVEPITRS